MEIYQIEKEHTNKTNHQINTILANELKQIKNIFFQLYSKNNYTQIDSLSESIQIHFKEITKYLSINEKKVLKAYLDYQLQDINEKVNMSQRLPNRRQKRNYSFFPSNMYGRISSNQNRLLQIFNNWFKSNIQLTKGLIKKKQIFLRQLGQGQQLLNSLFELILQEKQVKEQKSIKQQASNNLQQCVRWRQQHKYCEVTLILILITQYNLSIFLIYRRNYISARSLIDKFKITMQILKKQNNNKQIQIHNNLSLIQQLHKQQQKQIQLFLLSNRLNSLKIINNHQQKNNQQNYLENIEEENINLKFNKIIDSLIYKNKSINNQKNKICHFLFDIQNKISKLENNIFFQTHSQINLKINHIHIDFKLFTHQKLNKALKQFLSSKDQSNKLSISQHIFMQPNNSQRSIYLSVAKTRKSIELNVKDYFNLCLFFKMNKINKEAIIYFEILVFQFKKKQFISQYCIKQNFSLNSQDMQDIKQQQYHAIQQKLALKQLNKFIKNQEMIKIMVYSLVNLVQLYDLQNAHFWSVQTLNYLSHLIQHKIINILQKINCKLASAYKVNFFDQNHSTSQFLTNDQKKCLKLIQKYNKYLEQIKFKIIKNSFNSLTSQIIQKTAYQQKNKQKQFLLKGYKSSRESPCRILRESAPIAQSFNMQRLKQKQNQLQSLINSGRKALNAYNKTYQTSIQTPINRDKQSLNKISNIRILKENFKNQKGSIKGQVYKMKRKNIDIQKVGFFNKQKTLKSQLSKKQSEISQKKSQAKQRNQVRFNLVANQSFIPSIATITTHQSIDMGIKQKKYNTLNFLQTYKTLNQTSKTTRLGQFRQKILQSKQQLQDHIKLSFKKLTSCLKNVYNSSISLQQLKTQNYDFTSQTDQVLNDFCQLLNQLKSLRTYSQETFQRQILIQAKIKLLQMIKPKARHQKIIQVCVTLLNDIHLMKNSDDRIQLKKKILWQLAENYQTIKDVKKSISTYLQLARLGDPIGYLKIGETYMILKDYANCIKFHQKYASQQNYDLSSKVKLAHAYSKVPQYYMKTVDMLTGILIATGSSSRFKQQIYQRRFDDRLIESAVILLSSLYFKNQNVQKATELCENYCKINIKNYRVLHILGGYYRFRGNNKKSFQCYLNALQNNPTHHKSLIQLTQFICQGVQYKSHAIQLLRKCFCMESRNFELLRTLIRFLSDGKTNHEMLEYEEFSYNTLLKFAQILNHSQTNGFSGTNLYQQASLVYEWALSLLDKIICIANLDQVEQIYKNLGQICLKKGDYAKSETYYKLYLMQIQKYVNRSNLHQDLRFQKINKTKIQIFYFLGKVKKQQQSYKKAIDYFNKSVELQKQYQEKLHGLDSYFYWFQVGHCYFMLDQFELALHKFTQHKEHILYFISGYDGSFYKQQRKMDLNVPFYLQLKQKKQPEKKINFLKQLIINQNQSSQKQIQPQKQNNINDTEYVLKKSYFENQLYTAFCCDKLRRFIQSKQIYKKIILFLKQVQSSCQYRQKQKQTGKKLDIKDQQQKIKQNYFKQISSNSNCLNQEYKKFKKICLINLANIYKIEGLQNKYNQTMQQCSDQFPQNFAQYKSGRIWFHEEQKGRHKQIKKRINKKQNNLHQQECIRTFQTSLQDIQAIKPLKFYFDIPKHDQIRESIQSINQINK